MSTHFSSDSVSKKFAEQSCLRVSEPSGAVVKSTAIEPLQFVSKSIGITERQAAEERIRGQEAELRQMMDLTPLYMGLLGADGRRLYANHTALDYFGMTLEQ